MPVGIGFTSGTRPPQKIDSVAKMKQEISILNKLSQMPLYHVILTHVVQTPQGKTLPKSEAVPRARVIRNKRQLSIK